jgi:hypothetical protein
MFQPHYADAPQEAASLENCLRVNGRVVLAHATRVEAIVGETLVFGVRGADLGVTGRFQLVRAPVLPVDPKAPTDGPIYEAMQLTKPFMSGGQLAVSRPGLYVVRATLSGGWSRDIPVCCFPSKALDWLAIAPEKAQARRTRLRAILNDERFSLEAFASFENGKDVSFGLCGGLCFGADAKAFNPQSYGTGN